MELKLYLFWAKKYWTKYSMWNKVREDIRGNEMRSAVTGILKLAL